MNHKKNKFTLEEVMFGLLENGITVFIDGDTLLELPTVWTGEKLVHGKYYGTMVQYPGTELPVGTLSVDKNRGIIDEEGNQICFMKLLPQGESGYETLQDGEFICSQCDLLVSENDSSHC